MAALTFVDRTSDIQSIESTVRNRFKWFWLEERDSSGDLLANYFRKLPEPGLGYCTYCKRLNYASRGKCFIIRSSSCKKVIATMTKDYNVLIYISICLHSHLVFFFVCLFVLFYFLYFMYVNIVWYGKEWYFVSRKIFRQFKIWPFTGLLLNLAYMFFS